MVSITSILEGFVFVISEKNQEFAQTLGHNEIINRANEAGRNWKELAHDFADKFREDMEALHVNSMSAFQNASDSIESMIKNIQTLLDKKNAYIIEGDGVYFDISTFPEYGKLSHQNIEDLKAGSRVDINEKKRNPYDFALWKFEKPGEPSWEAPFGKGRPGWHIECSTMCNERFGPTLDIHGGGCDLIFPHHECEIAQSESISGKRFVNYWMHTGFLNISGEKMSKSLGNFKTIRDILKSWPPEAIRLFAVSNHYRSPVDFNPESLEQAKNSLERIITAKEALQEALKKSEEEKTAEDEEFIRKTAEFHEKILNAMDDDFNSPIAVSEFYNFIRESNRYIEKGKNKEAIKSALNLFDDINSFFDILPRKAEVSENEDMDEVMSILIKIREELRKKKDYELADKIRNRLNEAGIVLEDGKEGVKWKRKSRLILY